MGVNHNVSVRDLRSELREAGWSRADDAAGDSEVWTRRGGHRVKWSHRSSEVGPKQVHAIRKAIESARESAPANGHLPTGLAAATPVPDRQPELELLGPAVPEEGCVFAVLPGFRPRIVPGTLVVVLSLDPLTVEIPGRLGMPVTVEAWAAQIPPGTINTRLPLQAEEVVFAAPDPPVIVPAPRPAAEPQLKKPSPRQDQILGAIADAGRPLSLDEILAAVGGPNKRALEQLCVVMVKSGRVVRTQPGHYGAPGRDPVVAPSRRNGPGGRAHQATRPTGPVEPSAPMKTETPLMPLTALLGLAADAAPRDMVERVQRLLDAARRAREALAPYGGTGPVDDVAARAAEEIVRLARKVTEAESRLSVAARSVDEAGAALDEAGVARATRSHHTISLVDRVRLATTVWREQQGYTPKPASLVASAIPGWDEDRLRALASRVDPAGVVHAALGREPTREEILSTALTALERKLGGP